MFEFEDFVGAGQGAVDFNGDGALTVEGTVSGNLDLYAYGANTIQLTRGCAVTGDLSVENDSFEITTATSFGGGEYVYVGPISPLDIAATGVTIATTTTGYMEIHGLLTGSAFAPGLFYGSGTITGSFATGSTSTYRNDPTTGLTVQSALTLPAGKHLGLYFDDTTLPGSYAAINADGTVTLGATHSLDIWDGLVIPPGETFTLINKSSAGAVGGRFEDFAEGATLTTFDSEIFTISHLGGDGNDVVLTAAGGQAAAINDFSLTPGAGAELGLIVFEMTATGMPGGAYDLEASEDLLNWTVVQSVNADAMTGMMNFHIAQPLENFPIRFFRVR